MILDDFTRTYFSKENFIPYCAYYELYYQISLGHYVIQTTFDTEDAIGKIEELNLQVELPLLVETLKEILEHYSLQEDFKEKFLSYVKMRGSFQSLIDFTSKDKELINPQATIDKFAPAIIDESFWNDLMQLQFDEDLNDAIFRWSIILKDAN